MHRPPIDLHSRQPLCLMVAAQGGRWGGHLWNLFAGPAGHQCQRSEMEKAADAADTSVLFFSAGANF